MDEIACWIKYCIKTEFYYVRLLAQCAAVSLWVIRENHYNTAFETKFIKHINLNHPSRRRCDSDYWHTYFDSKSIKRRVITYPFTFTPQLGSNEAVQVGFPSPAENINAWKKLLTVKFSICLKINAALMCFHQIRNSMN